MADSGTTKVVWIIVGALVSLMSAAAIGLAGWALSSVSELQQKATSSRTVGSMLSAPRT